jgi:hypothetical protein
MPTHKDSAEIQLKRPGSHELRQAAKPRHQSCDILIAVAPRASLGPTRGPSAGRTALGQIQMNACSLPSHREKISVRCVSTLSDLVIGGSANAM